MSLPFECKLDRVARHSVAKSANAALRSSNEGNAVKLQRGSGLIPANYFANRMQFYRHTVVERDWPRYIKSSTCTRGQQGYAGEGSTTAAHVYDAADPILPTRRTGMIPSRTAQGDSHGGPALI